MTPTNRALKDAAVATPYLDEDGETVLWEWNRCPDCGHPNAHHHDKDGRGGVRCG
jgi:ribosomal protein S27AE